MLAAGRAVGGAQRGPSSTSTAHAHLHLQWPRWDEAQGHSGTAGRGGLAQISETASTPTIAQKREGGGL